MQYIRTGMTVRAVASILVPDEPPISEGTEGVVTEKISNGMWVDFQEGNQTRRAFCKKGEVESGIKV